MVYLVLDKGVILTKLFQLPSSETIGSAITHMAKNEALIGKGHQFCCAAHSLVRRILLCM